VVCVFLTDSTYCGSAIKSFAWAICREPSSGCRPLRLPLKERVGRRRAGTQPTPGKGGRVLASWEWKHGRNEPMRTCGNLPQIRGNLPPGGDRPQPGPASGSCGCWLRFRRQTPIGQAHERPPPHARRPLLAPRRIVLFRSRAASFLWFQPSCRSHRSSVDVPNGRPIGAPSSAGVESGFCDGICRRGLWALR
jgi:hypothetical protein